MDRSLRRTSAKSAVQGSVAMLLIGLVMSFVALASHRPAWCALGLPLLFALVRQGWRHHLRPARWAALGMALGPVALMLGLEFGDLDSGLARDLAIAAAAALFGGLSFAALRGQPALAATALAWHLLLAAPIDIARQPLPGGPLVQPLSVGLIKPSPTPEQAVQFVDAGCFASGLEPRWVVTWQDSTR